MECCGALPFAHPRRRSLPIVVEEFAWREYGHPFAARRRKVSCISRDQTVGFPRHG